MSEDELLIAQFAQLGLGVIIGFGICFIWLTLSVGVRLRRSWRGQ